MRRLLLGGGGRHAAWATLIVFLALQAGAGRLFEPARLALFDSYQQWFTLTRHTDAVVIVAIDDDSLRRIGQWPWSRTVQAQLISRIVAARPAAVGIDMLWLEPDLQSPEQWLRHAADDRLSPQTVSELAAMTHHDDVLAGVLAGQHIAIGIGVPETGGSVDGGPLTPFQLYLEPPPPYVPAILAHTPPALRGMAGRLLTPPDPRKTLADILPHFPRTLRSISPLDEAPGVGHGLLAVTPDPDGTFRRLPMVSLVSGRLAPGLEMEMLRLAFRDPQPSHFGLYFAHGAMEKISVGALEIPTQEDGSIWVNFSRRYRDRFVSAADVLEGKVPPSRFEKAMVLVGETGLGRVDQRHTPVDDIQGVEVHAQLLENILQGELATRPYWTRFAEPGLTLFFALLLIVTLPLLQRPRRQIALGGLVLLALGGLGAGLWLHAHILLDVATPAIGQAVVVIAYMGGGFAQADLQRRRLRQELEIRKLADARTEGELAAARRIQMGILPSPAGLSGDGRFELDALMIPARHIGGDLYDFFKIDEDHLFFAVGDVSGKGMPAALFMALGKSLCKSCALRGETDIADIINRTNREISRDNSEMLFITMFAAILNLATGELRFCNAGHDAPFLLRTGEAPHSLEAEGGPPLCIMDDFVYRAERFQLRPGDMLCVITDGITEAMTANGAVMGRTRAQEVLAALPLSAGPGAATGALHNAVEAYVAGAEASDDLTILAVRWRGPIAP